MVPGNDSSNLRRRERWVERAVLYLPPLAIYFAIAIPLAYKHRENVLGDAVSYIRRALYLSQGDLYHSISGYWSPLISWCMTPLMALGLDGAYAARVVLVTGGAALVVMAGVLFQVFTPLGRGWILAGLCAVAVATADVGAEHVTPDVLLAACLLGYFAVMLSPGLLRCRGMQLLAGALGGVAYLAKAYAFPFVLVHLPMTLVIRGWGMRRGECETGGTACLQAVSSSEEAQVASNPCHPNVRSLVTAWLVAMVGFVLVAGPWVGVLSWRYEHFTFSTSASRAHAAVGPSKANRTLPSWALMPDPYIVPWENPEDLVYKFWSPLESRKFFMHQVSVVLENGGKMFQTFWNLDLLHLTVVGLVLSPVAIALGRGRRWKLLWLVMTIGLYCSGFLPVWYSDRYIVSVAIPLSLLLCLAMILEPRNIEGGRPVWRFILAALVLASFAGAGAMNVRHLAKEVRRSNVYRQVAQEIRRRGIDGPIASTEMYKGYFTCLHADRKLVFVPPEENAAVIDQRLKECGVKALVVWASRKKNASEGLAELLRGSTWKRAFSRGDGVEVYVPTNSGGEEHD